MYKIFFLFIITVMCSCSSKKATDPKSVTLPVSANRISLTEPQIKNAGIETGKPEMRIMHRVLKVNGVVDVPPQGAITISFPLGGYVKSTDLLPGMPVKKGQVLAVIEDQSIIQLQQDFLVAKSKLIYYQKELNRQQLLNATKASSDKIFEQVTNDFQSVSISVKALKEKLLLIGMNPDKLSENSISRSVNLYSPINGFVSKVLVNIGKYVNPTDVLFNLVNTSDLHLALTVFEKDVPFVHAGQLVRAYLTSDSSTLYKGQVMLVSRTLDSNRSTMVHCHFSIGEPNLLPGMFMNAEIETTSDSVLAVPDDALVHSENKDYLFVWTENKSFELVPVTVGITENNYTAVSSNSLQLIHQVIIIKNAYWALMKMKNTGEEQ